MHAENPSPSSLQWTSGWSLKTQTRTISSRLRSATLRAVSFATRRNGRTVSVFFCSSSPTSSSGSSVRKYSQHACDMLTLSVNVLSQFICTECYCTIHVHFAICTVYCVQYVNFLYAHKSRINVQYSDRAHYRIIVCIIYKYSII